MVLKCIIRSCYVYSSDKTHPMFRLPSVYKRFDESERKLAESRLAIWVEACKLNKTPAPHHRICSRHFVSGKPAKHWEKNDVDWAPTLNLQDSAIEFPTIPMGCSSGHSTYSMEDGAFNSISFENQKETNYFSTVTENIDSEPLINQQERNHESFLDRNIDSESLVNQQDTSYQSMSEGNVDLSGFNQTSFEFDNNQEYA